MRKVINFGFLYAIYPEINAGVYLMKRKAKLLLSMNNMFNDRTSLISSVEAAGLRGYSRVSPQLICGSP